MKLLIRATIIYFPLILIYKVLVYTGEDLTIRNYWYNYYWLVSSIYFMVVFISVHKLCILKEHKRVAFITAIYWGVMAVLRVYLFINIDQYNELTRSAGKLTIGCISIALVFIYLITKNGTKSIR